MSTITTSKTGPFVLVGSQNGITVIPSNTPLTRLNYFDGKFLRAADLTAEQRYLRSLVEQSNRAGGHGVAHGFNVTEAGDAMLQISDGLAIDPEGRVLLLPGAVTVSLADLIEKSRQTPAGDLRLPRTASSGFGDCTIASETPPSAVLEIGDLFLITIASAEGLCGEEDVFGKLCEEACITSTDRPYRIDGVTIRARPLQPGLLPVSPLLGPIHLRSRVASAYFASERLLVASLISKEGLASELWCLGAPADAGSEVALAVVSRTGASIGFLDEWIARRERIDPPAKRYWQWRMAMRPWDVFLAQILQFQCQLRDCFKNGSTARGPDDPCQPHKKLLTEVSATVSVVTEYYLKVSEQLARLPGGAVPLAIPVPRELATLPALRDKLLDAQKTFALSPENRLLIRCGIIELPSAGYLPVVPNALLPVNQQVRQMMGEGVDLRFCVVRPDYVPHALEEAQHMERISLIEGIDNPKAKPQVDVLVPNGVILSQTSASPGNGFEATVNLSAVDLQIRENELTNHTLAQELNAVFRGAGRVEPSPSGGGAIYASAGFEAGPINGAVAVPATRAGLWFSLRSDRDILKMGPGDTAILDARGIIATAEPIVSLKLDIELSGAFTVTDKSTTPGGATTVNGTFKARLTTRGQKFAVDVAVTITRTSDTAVEFTLSLELVPGNKASAKFAVGWNKELTEVTARAAQLVFDHAGPGAGETPIAEAVLKKNSSILDSENQEHRHALNSLQMVANALKESNFFDAASLLLFPPPPPPTDDLLVRATLDWVLFHRRRSKQCSESKPAPSAPLPSRRYGVFHLRLKQPGSPDEIQRFVLSAASAGQLAAVTMVEFSGGEATLVTRSKTILDAWENAIPGNILIYALIANRASAAADGETLARSRLDQLEAVIAPSAPPSATTDGFFGQMPFPIAEALAPDGVVILVSTGVDGIAVATTCHNVFRVTGKDNLARVVKQLQSGVPLGKLVAGQDLVRLGEVKFPVGGVQIQGDGAREIKQAWDAQPRPATLTAAALVIRTDDSHPEIPREKQALAIENAITGNQNVGINSTTKITDLETDCTTVTIFEAVLPAEVKRTARLVIQTDVSGAGRFLPPFAPPVVLSFNADGTLSDAAQLLRDVRVAFGASRVNPPFSRLDYGMKPADPHDQAERRLKSVFDALSSIHPFVDHAAANVVDLTGPEQNLLKVDTQTVDEIIFLVK